MKKNIFFHFLKLFIILLLTYNTFVLSILYIPLTNIQNFLWKWTPYNYKQILYYPNNLREISLLSKDNRLLMLNFLNNPKINLEFREYFIKNYSKFSNKYKNKILKNFFN